MATTRASRPGPARSRRDDYAESTRKALVDSAVALFTERGYAGTSLDEIARRARVTKGALYHHFEGKQAIFEAAFDAVETDVKGRLETILRGDQPPWDRALDGLREFISSCLDPAYQRIALHEAPVVMGWARWREAEDRYSFGLIKAALGDLIDAGDVVSVPVDITSRLLFGALSSAATEIAGSSEPKRVGAEVEQVVIALLEQVRAASRRG
ncbi:TetR/AcrR family transcriptional regulator [Saccharomonospora azurea]|uniref:Transcriptional regulator n=1 Tax=Saccharomonospora azurea NA-128 TaxID=882081 RepID=H8GBY9_9PSEU|nr:TetR/AcrR family transcriptional regulator [Saccharomonospora azurea]EHY90758.1 transcriptional regulator [Saccharomonospora azurea NA-128]